MNGFALNLKQRIREEILFKFPSITAFADANKLQRTYIQNLLNPAYKPSLNSLVKICDALGLEIKIGSKK